MRDAKDCTVMAPLTVGGTGLVALAVLCVVGLTLVYVLLLWLADPYERDPINHVIVLLALGASVPPLLTRLAEAAFGLPASIFPTLLQPYALTPLSVWTGLIEEAAKALVVLGAFALLRRGIHDTLDGIVVGAVVGAGFALAEGLVYVEDLAPVARIAHVAPGVPFALFAAGLSQCAFTAVFGACLGYVRDSAPRRWLIPVLGFATAAVYHTAYVGLDTLASSVLPSAVAGAAGIARAYADWIGGLLVIAAVGWAWERERRIMQATLPEEIATGAVTPSEFASLTTLDRLGRPFHAVLGERSAAWQGARAVYGAQIRLAFAKWRRRRGAGTDDEVSRARDEIGRLRGRGLQAAAGRPPIPEAASLGRVLPRGVGAACACVTLLAAGAVILTQLGVITPGIGPGTRAGRTPPSTRGLLISLVLERLDRTHTPVQQTNLFEIGDLVGATATIVAVPEPLRAQAIWLRAGQDTAIPISDLETLAIGPDAAGQSKTYELAGAPAGTYLFLIAQPGAGRELHQVVVQRFFVQ
ncbi:MAG TPA: PrsW family glutamic-type intramembrane protease [bacterium]|nr:PrsW family glutamic-type intramembrane protease [bacterium]